MKIQIPRRPASETGYSLITTLILIMSAAILMASTLSRTMSGSKMNDRNNAFIIANAAAEAATEKVLSRMSVDFAVGGETMLSNNLSYYQNSMLPSASENPFWTNFVFSDGQGNVGQTFVKRMTLDVNPPYVSLTTQYPGLKAFAANYRIVSNVTPASNSYGGYNFTNAVCQDIQMAEIPIFQMAIFYNGLLEFSDCATMTVNGRVHCNSNIYVGTPSSSTLTFNYMVTSSRTITNPPNVGMAQSSWTGTTTYNGTPSPGWGTGEPVLTLPMGGATVSPAEIIQLPDPGEDATATTNSLSLQRYYYKAGLVILVTNITTALNGTNVTNVLTTVRMKGNMFDSSPLVVSYTNNLPTNTPALWTNYLRMTTNWNWYGCGNWLSTNVTFYDARQNQTNLVTQIDVGKFGTWIATNTNATAKWNNSTPFNGIVYVADYRTTNGMYMDCVRLTNGQTIPSYGASNLNIGGTSVTNQSYPIPGLSVATVNPLYIVGLYNCPGTNNVNATNTIGCRPCSVVCDALTILSPAWTDSASFSGSVPNANSDTVNTAIVAGNVPSTGTGVSQYSGGVHNLTRLLENWGGDTLWLNTSIVNLYPSAQATHQFEQPSAYYSAPTRKFSFDLNFTDPAGLPPGTPLVNRMIRGTWWTPKANDVASTFNTTNWFVPQ